MAPEEISLWLLFSDRFFSVIIVAQLLIQARLICLTVMLWKKFAAMLLVHKSGYVRIVEGTYWCSLNLSSALSSHQVTRTSHIQGEWCPKPQSQPQQKNHRVINIIELINRDWARHKLAWAGDTANFLQVECSAEWPTSADPDVTQVSVLGNSP